MNAEQRAIVDVAVGVFQMQLDGELRAIVALVPDGFTIERALEAEPRLRALQQTDPTIAEVLRIAAKFREHVQ